jgi:hypothetical protein
MRRILGCTKVSNNIKFTNEEPIRLGAKTDKGHFLAFWKIEDFNHLEGEDVISQGLKNCGPKAFPSKWKWNQSHRQDHKLAITD